jgi:hypothetical protein
MHSLNIVRMIVSPRSSYAPGMDVIGNDVVVVGEGFLADGALLLCSTILRLSSFRIGTELPVPSRVMRVFDTQS